MTNAEAYRITVAFYKKEMFRILMPPPYGFDIDRTPKQLPIIFPSGCYTDAKSWIASSKKRLLEFKAEFAAKADEEFNGFLWEEKERMTYAK